MMNFELEHDDIFSDCTIFWLQANNIQKRFIKQAKQIDGENFSIDCFGICVNCEIDIDSKESNNKKFFVSQDNSCELYYIDIDGEKHWFNYILTKKENEKAISYCKEFISCFII